MSRGGSKGRKKVGVSNGTRLRKRIATVDARVAERAELSGYPLRLIARDVVFFDPFEYTQETEHARLLLHAFNAPKDRNNGSGPIPARAV